MNNLLSEIIELYSDIESMIDDYEFCANHQVADIDFILYQNLGELKMAEIICSKINNNKLAIIISKHIADLKKQLTKYKA
ncbi:MAG: hypothetical protein R3D71_09995 [Rickettsiales bacterium]